MRVQSLSWEDPPEEGMATHSSILAWRIPWTEEPDRLQSTGSQRIGHNWSDLAHTHTHTHQGKKLKFRPSMGIHLMVINQVAYMCMIPLFLHFFLTIKRGNGTHIMVCGAGQVWPVKKRRFKAHVKITENLKCCPTGPEIISAIPRLVWSKTQNE